MNHSESKIQAEIVKAFQERGIFCHSVPNEGAGKDAAIRTGRLITMGLKPGVADLVVFHPAGSVTYIEVKAIGGKQSPAQIKFQARCKEHGVGYHVVYSLQDALDLICNCHYDNTHE